MAKSVHKLDLIFIHGAGAHTLLIHYEWTIT